MSVRVRLPLLLAAAAFGSAAGARADGPPPTSRPETVPPTAPAAEPPPLVGAAKVKLDADRQMFAEVLYDTPLRSEDQSPGEFRAYNEVVLHARRQDDAELREYARKTVTFKDLVTVRKDPESGQLAYPGQSFQYDLLFFEGRLKSLRDVKPTKQLAEAGVTELYEAWLFPKDGADPMCVLVTEIPEGLEPAVEYEQARPVSVAGYFFKLIQYESKNPDPKLRLRRAPLLIGKTLAVGPAGDGRPAEDDWWAGFLPGMLAMLGLLATTGFGLTWYFRRGDRAHQQARADRLEKNNPFGAAGP